LAAAAIEHLLASVHAETISSGTNGAGSNKLCANALERDPAAREFVLNGNGLCAR
jgi:hypothetical protein